MDAAFILRMEEQHERIAELYHRAGGEARTFVARVDEPSRQALAETLVELNAALDAHLRDEEVHILPVVERVMTVDQWNRLGERGRAGIPKDRMLVFLGALLHANTPEHGREFLRKLPLPARMAWRTVGRRSYAREYRRIHGVDPT
jgi:hypothetical protein